MDCITHHITFIRTVFGQLLDLDLLFDRTVILFLCDHLFIIHLFEYFVPFL